MKPTEKPGLPEPADFSLVLGGPLYQLLRRAHLAGDALQLLRRRILGLILISWLPLLVLAALEGHLWSGVQLPFLLDAEVQVRFLFALPLLVAAELVVHQRVRPVIRQFMDRGLIPEAARAQFDAAITAAMQLRNSVKAEVALLAFVYLVGVSWIWRTQLVLDVAGWHGVSVDGSLKPSLAGWWFGCVSLPLFQFLLLRWYFRFFIWARLLWHISRIDLNLMPVHPDRCGGIGFLAQVSYAFSPLLLAQGALLSGMMAGRIFFAGAKLSDFKLELIGLVAMMVMTVLGPLLVFSPTLDRAKRKGLGEYEALAQRYASEFDHKWLRGGTASNEPLLGSADLQSLADLGNSFEVIRSMRLAPFTLQTVLQLAVVTLIPVAPLLLTMISLEELIERLLKAIF